MMDQFKSIISHFAISGTVSEIKPLGNGLINDTYKVTTVEADALTTYCNVSTTPYSPMSISCSTTLRR